jgi:enoyl-CoA hydratase/carnithine racemase
MTGVNTENTLLVERRSGMCIISLNRPERMNALNGELVRRIEEAVEEFDDDDELFVMIITSEGGRAFSAGADLIEMAMQTTPGDALGAGATFLSAVDRCRKPLIAAIDGYALAGGLELALYCDIRVATIPSSFGLPEPRRSLLAGPGLHNLSRMIPLGEALRIQLTGGHITAQRAYEIGLVQILAPDRVVLMAEAERLAEEIMLCAPLAVQAIKHIVKVGRNLPVEYSKVIAEPFEERIYNSEDFREGPAAFAEKRLPKWKMR